MGIVCPCCVNNMRIIMYKVEDLKVGNLLIFVVNGEYQYDLILKIDKYQQKIEFLSMCDDCVEIENHSFRIQQRDMDKFFKKNH